jgi:hypothetical protein
MPKQLPNGWVQYKPGEEIPTEHLSEEGMTSEDWRDYKEMQKQRRRDNHGEFVQGNQTRLIAQQTGCKVVQKGPYHYHVLEVGDKLLDYWPSSRRWRWKGKTYFGKVESLIGFINKRNRQKGNENGTQRSNLSQQPAEDDAGSSGRET